jgi:CheY-like chemotaxis protein
MSSDSQHGRTESSPVTLLIADDDDGHAELIQDLLQEAGMSHPIVRCRDGQEMLDLLAGRGPRPLESGQRYLLMLDIRMPRVDGVEVLRRVKTDPRWREMPTIMLTTTDDPREIQTCYRLGCNCYIAKPVDFDRFAEVLRQLGRLLMMIQVPKLKSEPLECQPPGLATRLRETSTLGP